VKGIPLITILALLLVAPGFAADFRKAEWGMTKEQVKAIEREEPLKGKGESLLKYKTQIMGLDAQIHYYFERDRLKHGSYDFISVPDSASNEVFDALIGKISKKYGKAKEEIIWEDSSLETPEPTSTAVALGLLKRTAEWQTERTIIRAELSCEKYGDPIKLVIYYMSREDTQQEEMKWIEETF